MLELVLILLVLTGVVAFASVVTSGRARRRASDLAESRNVHLVAGQAWNTGFSAHLRLASLEERVRALERQAHEQVAERKP